jgi:Ca-activated chloride channel family protein
MSFASPALLAALLIVPVTLIFVVLVHRRRARHPIAFTNLDLLASVVETRRSIKRWIPLALLLLALGTAATAVARPQARLSTSEENATIVLVVDVSGSMRATDVKPSRLDAAVTAMREFVDKVPKKYKIGLVAFSTTAETLQQPTNDREAIRRALGYLSPEAATALGDGLLAGIRMVVDSLQKVGVQHEPGKFLPGAIVLESDGAQNRGVNTPNKAALYAKASGVRIYGVALGTPKGTVNFGYGLYETKVKVPPDIPTVMRISKLSGGRGYTAQNADEVVNVYRDLGSSLGRKVENREITSWFAAMSAMLLLGAVGLSRLWSAPLP